MEEIHQQYLAALQTMGQDNAAIIDTVFKWCVVALVDLAAWLGITYEFINIIVFVVVWPLLTLWLMLWVLVLKLRVRRLKRSSLKAQS